MIYLFYRYIIGRIYYGWQALRRRIKGEKPEEDVLTKMASQMGVSRRECFRRVQHEWFVQGMKGISE